MITPTLTVVVLATATVGELLPLPRITGRPLPTSIAVVGAFALFGAPGWAVIVVAVAARALAMVIDRKPGRGVLSPLVHAAVAGWIIAVAAGLGALIPWASVPDVPVHLGSATLLTAVIVVGLPWWAALRGEGGDGPVSVRFAHLVRDNWMTEVAVASTAVLGALVQPRLGALSVPFVLLPLLAARSGLEKFLAIRRQHDQTIRAISRLPEELGEVAVDHSERTAQLVDTAARNLELSTEVRSGLVRAARLHELGRIRHEPGEDNGPRTIALNGASILHQSGLTEVATMVGTHRDHILGTGRGPTLLRLACELDQALTRTGDPPMALSEVAAAVTDPGERQLLAAYELGTIGAGAIVRVG